MRILDSGPMPNMPGMSGSALRRNPLDLYQSTVERLLKEHGYPTTSMELDSLIDQDLDNGDNPDDLAMQFTLLLRLVHRARSAWRKNDVSDFGYFMGQLSRVTAQARYYEILPHATRGLKSYLGSKKGGERSAKTRSVPAQKIHRAVLQYCNTLLTTRRRIRKHELAGLAHKKFSTQPGFPTSQRRYRSIVKLLEVENLSEKMAEKS